MIVEKMKKAFNFPDNANEVIDELIFMFEKEESNKPIENKNEESFKNSKTFLYEILSDSNCIENWKSVNEININRVIFKIDKKLKELERQEANLKGEQCTEDTDIVSKEQYRKVFETYSPKEDSSEFYKFFYIIAFLYLIVTQKHSGQYDEKFVNNVLRKMFVYRIPVISSGSVIGEISSMMTKKEMKWEAKRKENLEVKFNEFLINVCRKALLKETISENEQKLLLLSIQCSVFTQSLLNKNSYNKDTIKNICSMLGLYISNYCRNRNDNEFGIKFGKIALCILDPEKRQDAYNILGLCAVDSEQYQLAYDVYLTWISKHFPERNLIEENNYSDLQTLLQSKNEEEWRKNNSELVAQMYGNFAYVCGAMYDTLDDGYRKRRFMFIAEDFILKAIKLNPKSDDYYCSAGTIFFDLKNYSESLKYYRKYMEHAKNKVNKLTAMRSIISVYEAMIETGKENQLPDEFYDVSERFVELYKMCMKDKYRKDVGDELNNGANLYFLFCECEKLSSNSKKAKILLFRISAEVNHILKNLKQTSSYEYKYDLRFESLSSDLQVLLKNINNRTYRGTKKRKKAKNKEIAYYTKLKDLQFLFSEIPDPKDANTTLNCLTMMHARYMNDPDEGLILLKKFKDNLPASPEELRDNLYDQKFVFLKSFTSLVDQLNMWTMYGSDKSEGADCNGCCVCLAPETFDLIIRRVEDEQKNTIVPLKFNNDDDFHLYNVAYIEDNTVFVNGQKDIYLKKYYLSLKNHMENLSQLSKKWNIKDKEILSACLVRLFEKIIFLFKDVSYSLEGESRLIIIRDIKDRKDLHYTDQTPPRIYINPPYQIFPEKIILGPKVENSDYLIPHLQFELSKISEKWNEKDMRELRPSVRASKINIR